MKKTILSIFAIFVSITSYSQVTDGLVAHFKLDSMDFTDETGTANGINSSRGNGSFSSDLDKTSTSGTATEFKGGIMEAGADLRKITNSISVSAWVKTTLSDDTIKIIVSKYNCSVLSGFLLYVKSGKVALDIRDNSSKGYMVSGLSSQKVNDGAWHHIVGSVSSAGVVSIWVDGRTGSHMSYGTINSLESLCGLAISGLPSLNTKNKARPFIGSIDEVRIYNRALDSLEVDTLYQYPYPNSSVDNSINSLQLSVYPNPTNQFLFIDAEVNNVFTFNVTDAVGKSVSSGETRDQIDLAKLSDGIYVLTLTNPEGIRVHLKFVKRE